MLIILLKSLKNILGPTSGFIGTDIACDYCYDAIPQNPSRYPSADPCRWADSNDPTFANNHDSITYLPKTNTFYH